MEAVIYLYKSLSFKRTLAYILPFVKKNLTFPSVDIARQETTIIELNTADEETMLVIL